VNATCLQLLSLLTPPMRSRVTSEAAREEYHHDPCLCWGSRGRCMQQHTIGGLGGPFDVLRVCSSTLHLGRCVLLKVTVCAASTCRPWFLLVPQYVARKAFFLEWLNNKRPKGTPKPSYVAPTRTPYVFTAPNRAGRCCSKCSLIAAALLLSSAEHSCCQRDSPPCTPYVHTAPTGTTAVCCPWCLICASNTTLLSGDHNTFL
jgi:hypothetical protein